MNDYNHTLPKASGRDYKKIIGAAILVILLLLIFFSKTIHSYNLPVITAAKPENGRLNKLEISYGVTHWSEIENVYSVVGGKVEEIFVKEGDAVVQGQELLRLGFDRQEAERKLREIQNSRSRLQNDIAAINVKLEKQRRYISELENKTYEQEEISTYELDSVSRDISKAEEELQVTQKLYEVGAVAEKEMNKAEDALKTLYLKQEELKRKLEEQEKASIESVDAQKKSQQSKLKDYESDIAALELELRAKQIELNSLFIQEEPYKKTLSDFEAYAVVAAPINGTVITLNAEKGETVHADRLIAAVGSVGEYELECAVSLDNNFVIAGDTVPLSNSSHVTEGIVTKVTPSIQNKTVTISIESDEITAGETFDVVFKKESETTYTLVPNGAVNQDNDGYFINQVKRRDGILGQEYYLERLNVYIGDSDSENTAVIQGITFFEPVAVISNKPVAAGDVVSLSNEGDFFER